MRAPNPAMKLELSTEDARFLEAQLTRHLAELDDELVHTEKRSLRTALAEDAERLRRIVGQLRHFLDGADAVA
jgi:hypothetical protein